MRRIKTHKERLFSDSVCFWAIILFKSRLAHSTCSVLIKPKSAVNKHLLVIQKWYFGIFKIPIQEIYTYKSHWYCTVLGAVCKSGFLFYNSFRVPPIILFFGKYKTIEGGLLLLAVIIHIFIPIFNFGHKKTR